MRRLDYHGFKELVEAERVRVEQIRTRGTTALEHLNVVTPELLKGVSRDALIKAKADYASLGSAEAQRVARLIETELQLRQLVSETGTSNYVKATFLVALATLVLTLAACGADDEVEGYTALERHVTNNRVGGDADHWIEMKNMAGEWERTGLIFGYADDYDECTKAVAGLKKVNFAREYRCTPAN